jgi:heat shock protein HtpX
MKIWNTFKATILLAMLTGLLVAAGSALGGQTGMVVAFGLAVVMNMGAWWFSDKIALRMSGAREMGFDEAPELHQMLEELSTRAGLPKPRLFFIDTDAPNAFATGRSPGNSAVAVTSGIVKILNRTELAGVIAHELAHIKHRDTLISSIAATIAGAITMLAEIAQWTLIFGLGGFAGDEEEGGLGDLLGGLAMILLAPIAALLIQLAISRSREFSADAGGAEILGDPLPLASALQKLETGANRAPMDVNPAVSPLYIVNPLHGGLSGLFRTHPDTAERVKRLHAMARPEALWAAGLR